MQPLWRCWRAGAGTCSLISLFCAAPVLSWAATNSAPAVSNDAALEALAATTNAWQREMLNQAAELRRSETISYALVGLVVASLLTNLLAFAWLRKAVPAAAAPAQRVEAALARLDFKTHLDALRATRSALEGATAEAAAQSATLQETLELLRRHDASLAAPRPVAIPSETPRSGNERPTMEENRLSKRERDQRKSGLAREQAAKKAQSDASQAAWPVAFRGDGPLAPWRDTITAEAQDEGMARLRQEIIGLEGLMSQASPNPEQTAEALYQMSVDAHRLWRDKADHDFVNTAIQWRDAFNEILVKRNVPLKIRAAFPKEPFDIDCMVVPEGSSDSRLYVKEPLSWIILGESNKVLRRGLMLTV